jgi:isoquinoline 1-oxidoreductase subunit beta
MDRSKTAFHPSRRLFLKASVAAGAGLCIGFQLSCSSDSADPPATVTPTPDFVPNAFVRIGADSTITIISKHIEFGQGTFTGLATILAEELDAAWEQVRVEHAPSDASRYANLFFAEFPNIGRPMATGGSTAMANSWMQMREAGATARAMLVAAAAATWGVPEGEIRVERGVVSGPSGKSATFGELTRVAAGLSLPAGVKLKDPQDFTLIGSTLPRVDVTPKTNGAAKFTMDIYMENMLTAVIARPPRFGARVASVNDAAARQVPGVVDVVQIPSGVAVLADDFWAARMGREALIITWDESAAETRGTPELFAEFRALAGQPGLEFRNDGDATAAIDGAATILEADFEFPYLAHAPMEPLDCVIRLDGQTCDLWAGSQAPTFDQLAISQILQIPIENVNVHVQLAGGSFGRRATPDADCAAEAAFVAVAARTNRPIKIIWTREDDIRGGKYRPMSIHRVRAGLDASGTFTGWHDRIVEQSIQAAFLPPGVPDTSITEGANIAYAVPNARIDVHTPVVGVPVLWWRSVEHTHNAFVIEVMIDELAEAAGRDPYEFRRALLAEHPRHLGVLDLVAERSGWANPPPAGRARGIAVQESFGSYVAQVAEVSVGADGMPVVHRVVCAVDCGIAINPDNIRAQMEGGLGFGLAAAMHNAITLDAGRVVQSNFHDYRLFRIHEMPEVEVHIVPSAAPPTGVGEPATPVIAPAVANAWRRLTRTPVRSLPFQPVSQG